MLELFGPQDTANKYDSMYDPPCFEDPINSHNGAISAITIEGVF